DGRCSGKRWRPATSQTPLTSTRSPACLSAPSTAAMSPLTASPTTGRTACSAPYGHPTPAPPHRAMSTIRDREGSDALAVAGSPRGLDHRRELRCAGGGLATGSVAARGRSDDVGESCDEAAGVGPSARVGGLGGVVAVGEEHERVVDA